MHVKMGKEWKKETKQIYGPLHIQISESEQLP